MSTARISINPSVVHQRFDDEVLVLNLNTGIYYTLANLGADIWQGIQRNLHLDELVDAVVATHKEAAATVESAVRAIVAQLRGESLIEVEPRGAAGLETTATLDAAPIALMQSSLQRHPDLQKMLFFS